MSESMHLKTLLYSMVPIIICTLKNSPSYLFPHICILPCIYLAGLSGLHLA